MERRPWLALLMLLLLLSACQSAVPVEEGEMVNSGDLTGGSETATLPPSRTPTLVEASPTFTPGTIPTSPTSPSPSPTATPVPAIPPLQLFSPLAEHALEELPGIVSSPYDPPAWWDDARHQGVDFCYFDGDERAFIAGESVRAIFSGRVAASIEERLPYGNMIMIETRYEELPDEYILRLGIQPGESLYHLYAHFQEPPVFDLGARIEGGQAIGQVGETGYNIVTAHLHFETRLGPSGAVFESMAYYDVGAIEEEMTAYELWRTSDVFRHFDPMEVLWGAEAAE